ncbi:MAG: amidohydrolase family protein, partial [Clostridia bacterium]|nr:amidohydrolase family protein [Clostridia bacterium]
MAELKALKGNIICAEKVGELTIVEQGYIVILDGVIQGVYRELPEEYASAAVEDWGDGIITPSFSDLHIHGPQFAMVGTGMDLQLLEWLNTYAFPTESKYASEDYARMQYRRLAKALIERGTTRVCMFSSLHRKATNILMDELEAVGITGYVGKVNMDRNGGENLQETTEESVSETIRWIEENADRKLIKPMITPR